MVSDAQPRPSDPQSAGRDWPAPLARHTGAIPTSSLPVGDGRALCFEMRFGSGVMDEANPCAAFLPVALDPVRARRAARAADGTWASTIAYLSGRPEGVTLLPPLTGRWPDLARRLAVAEAEGGVAPMVRALRRSKTTGRPAGNAEQGWNSVSAAPWPGEHPGERRCSGSATSRPCCSRGEWVACRRNRWGYVQCRPNRN
jgi:hypothetical protein